MVRPSFFALFLVLLSVAEMALASEVLHFPKVDMKIPDGWKMVKAPKFLTGLAELEHLKTGDHFFLRHSVINRPIKDKRRRFDEASDCEQSGRKESQFSTTFNQKSRVCSYTLKSTGVEMQAIRILSLGEVKGQEQLLTLVLYRDQGLNNVWAPELMSAMAQMKVDKPKR